MNTPIWTLQNFVICHWEGLWDVTYIANEGFQLGVAPLQQWMCLWKRLSNMISVTKANNCKIISSPIYAFICSVKALGIWLLLPSREACKNQVSSLESLRCENFSLQRPWGGDVHCCWLTRTWYEFGKFVHCINGDPKVKCILGKTLWFALLRVLTFDFVLKTSLEGDT